MKIKKITSLLLVLTFLIAELSFLSFGGISIAASPNKDLSLDTYSKDYYGRQLNEQAWKFYNAMVDMYNNDIFKKGQDYNLLEKGVVEETDLLKYATGTTQLLYDMTAARDAFQYDYPEVFWVDWSAISLRVTRNSNGEYFAFLGRGKRDDYYLPGFNKDNVDKAIEDYEQLLDEAITEIRAQAKQEDNEDSRNYELAKAAHNWEMNQMSYKFEYEVDNYNTDTPYSNARTAYDCLKYGEGVCESYTRAYKAILDKLGINCIVAGGGYKVSDTQTENHAWNYVQIGGKWYGVDVTHDDDENSNKQSRKYFMVGTAELFDRRIESGIFSQSMFEFKYPTLETSSLQEIEEEYDDGKFYVEVITSDYVEEGDHAGDDAGHVLKDTFRLFVSYDDKDYTQNAEQGKYMLARFATFDEDTNTWTYTPWGYITPDLYPVLEEKTGEKNGKPYRYIDFKLPQVELVQFAVADKGPKINEETGAPHIDELYYKGDASLLEERTKTFINNTGNIYQAPPYIKKATPPQNVKLGFESTYRVKVEYDDYFDAEEGQTTGNIAITAVYKPDRTTRNDLIKSSKISNVSYHLGNANENAWVEFDFTPSAQFSANEVAYDITWQGVVGHKSKKAPMPANYAVGNKCDFCALSGQGIDCNVFAQPELMDTSNLSTEGWKTKGENGEEVELPKELAGANLDQLSHRLTLSTTSIADDESLDMVNGLTELNNKNATTESYNIRMQLCKKQVVNTGNSVRIRLGFPEGTTYEDYISGRREFKVYHYFYDELGTITGHEEIPVEVVPQGLILYVKSFSPFTIAGIEVPQEEQEAKAEKAKEKVLMLASTEGGYITYEGSETEKIDMKDKEEVTIIIHPDENRTIESIAVGSTVIPLISENIKRNDDGTFSFKVKRDELSDGATMVYVKLMSSLIVEEDIDEDHGYQVEQPEEDKYVDTTDSDGNGYCDIHPSTATTIEALIAEKSVPGVKVEVLDASGNAVTDTGKLLGTGMKIRISNDKNSSHIYTETEIVVSGDMTGDGLMNANDIKNWRIGILSESLEGAFKMAADYNNDGKQDATDMRNMRTDIVSTL